MRILIISVTLFCFLCAVLASAGPLSASLRTPAESVDLFHGSRAFLNTVKTAQFDGSLVTYGGHDAREENCKIECTLFETHCKNRADYKFNPGKHTANLPKYQAIYLSSV